MYLAHGPVTTTNINYKINDVLGNKCKGTIGDIKLTCTSPYNSAEPVILLHPEDTRLTKKNSKMLNIVDIIIMLIMLVIVILVCPGNLSTARNSYQL